MRLFLFSCFLLLSFCVYSQGVNWHVQKKGDIISITGSIQAGWHIYASDDSVIGLEKIKLQSADHLLQPAFTSSTHDISDKLFDGKKLTVYDNEINFTVDPGTSAKIYLSAFASDGNTFLPVNDTIRIPVSSPVATTLRLSSIDLTHPVNSCGNASNTVDKSLLAIFLLGLAGGLLSLLTPCVFPMIPVSVSFFTNSGSLDIPAAKRRGIMNGLSYGVSILGIYGLASVPFHLVSNIDPQLFNKIATSAGLNVFFFLVFVLFSLAFFGVLNISLPSWAANKAGSKSGKQSFLGIFFMALTLVIVSFSCTGPILGSLLAGSISGGAWQLTAGMLGFGTALAFPFALFAMFPSWLKRLPKSGGWMETFKKSLAFIELALAIKFLSNADLVKHWGILKREIFICTWIIISLALALYLFGVFENLRVGIWRKLFSGIAFLFAIYLIPGLTSGKDLKLLSGFPPPASYSIYGNHHGTVEPLVTNDYAKALQLSREQHKPILIDFTGWACVNCRKMEELVWSKPEIASLINDDFILLSLYVDDKKKLTSPEVFDGTDIETIGDKWAAFQRINFNQVSQPMYAVLSPDEKLLNNPVGYTPSVTEYKKWLECGLSAYKK